MLGVGGDGEVVVGVWGWMGHVGLLPSGLIMIITL